MEQKSFSELLKEQAAHHGYGVEKLSHLTSIPDRYITALLEGELKKLPPGPYVRGYLLKLAPLLDLDPQTLWEAYKNDQNIRVSGGEDKLPSNRFAIKPVNKKLAVGILTAVLLGVYIFWNIGHLIGQPLLDISYPAAQTVITAESLARLVGYIDPADKLFINYEEVVIDENGNFEQFYNLEPGLNSVEFTVKRFLGRETKAIRQIIYQPQ